MSREWKPGDVGNVPCFGGFATGLRTQNGWVTKYNPDPVEGFAEVRPLVVIDPEDREQVERLTGALAIHGANSNDCNYWRETQVALRSLIDPPKPPEPTGLGAVVEDVEGTRWVRTEGPPARVTGYVWTSAFSTALPDKAVTRQYADIAAVRVLTKGVTA